MPYEAHLAESDDYKYIFTFWQHLVIDCRRNLLCLCYVRLPFERHPLQSAGSYGYSDSPQADGLIVRAQAA